MPVPGFTSLLCRGSTREILKDQRLVLDHFCRGLKAGDFFLEGGGGFLQTQQFFGPELRLYNALDTTLTNKAQILEKLGRSDEAKRTMDLAIHDRTAGPLEIHQYGRSLLAQHKEKEALGVFRLNFERNGDTWPVHVGLARGYAATGDAKQALEHARKALAQAPDPVNRQSLEAMVAALEANRPIAQ